mmetsp:Transcript_15185/g.30911  ORF Transcript_15185/g.30911 Transcript_15185/m.30911 type:complete len:399 (+) Transcript_15185:150-1346(+)
MNFNAVAHFLLLTVASSDAAFLRSGAEDAAAAAGVCSDGQIYVVNNCGATLKHHGDVKGTKTIQSGCQDLSGPNQRIWVGSDDSTVYSKHNTLFEYTYWSPGHNGDFQLSWDVSLLTGYNYPVKVENNGQTLLDVTGPSCGGVREGLFPCSQKANACVENSFKWQPICAGCNSSCCDTTDDDHDCNPPDIDNTQNMVLTFCPNEPPSTPEPTPLSSDHIKISSDASESDAVTLDVTVTADVEALQTCVHEGHPVTVFYSAHDYVNLSSSQTTTHSITQTVAGLHFGIQVNDWYWRSNANPYTGQWSDNAGLEVIIKDPSTCHFELTPSWGDSGAPDAREVLGLSSSMSASGGCSFTVTRKANSSLHITKDCVGPCIGADEKGCTCIAGGSTASCPTEK